ncbi:protein-lysine methyltransferase METTL21D [Tripterygium wilfordii]|uniref:Protein-lysine methyltransferase METTL21D n=1 Tax=Tripterygium wilfordii TaxID=458696 RepID=A0A7J7C8F6_TRIWF|nr:protein-lysine methyltransferase METTL21D [Tripterygium wilfordii]
MVQSSEIVPPKRTKEEMEEEGDEMSLMKKLGLYGGEVRLVDEGEDSAAEEMMLLWGLQQPALSKPNAFVSQSSLHLSLDACGHSLSILQSPSSLVAFFISSLNCLSPPPPPTVSLTFLLLLFFFLSLSLSIILVLQSTPGVTGSVMWDSGVVLAKFLEHAVDSGLLLLQGKKVVELGSGCGLVGCVATLLGAKVFLTDLPDRLRLLKKNIEANLRHVDLRGSALAKELTWGDVPDPELVQPLPHYVLGSDVIYSEGAVVELLETLQQLSGSETTIFLAGELRNDSVLEYFLEAAMKDFVVGRVGQKQWHPDYCSRRVVMYVMVRK